MRFVIASRTDGGGFAVIGPGEAIQLFSSQDWIASSPSSLEGERLGSSQ